MDIENGDLSRLLSVCVWTCTLLSSRSNAYWARLLFTKQTHDSLAGEMEKL